MCSVTWTCAGLESDLSDGSSLHWNSLKKFINDLKTILSGDWQSILVPYDVVVLFVFILWEKKGFVSKVTMFLQTFLHMTDLNILLWHIADLKCV